MNWAAGQERFTREKKNGQGKRKENLLLLCIKVLPRISCSGRPCKNLSLHCQLLQQCPVRQMASDAAAGFFFFSLHFFQSWMLPICSPKLYYSSALYRDISTGQCSLRSRARRSPSLCARLSQAIPWKTRDFRQEEEKNLFFCCDGNTVRLTIRIIA